MKWKGRPQSKNIEDRRQPKSAFSSYGRKQYNAAWMDSLADAGKARMKRTRKKRVNGR